jgi:hypothetical protein
MATIPETWAPLPLSHPPQPAVRSEWGAPAPAAGDAMGRDVPGSATGVGGSTLVGCCDRIIP